MAILKLKSPCCDFRWGFLGKELKKMGDDAVIYKTIGMLLVKKDKESITKDLTERRELLSVRASVLGKQEERTREKLRELQQQIQSRLGQQQPT